MRSNRTLKYFRFYIKAAPDLTGKEKTALLKRLRRISLAKIGETYNVTEARIRQIEKSAIKKIRSKVRQQNLFGKDKS